MPRKMRRECSSCVWCIYNSYGGFPSRNGDYKCHYFMIKVTAHEEPCDMFHMARYKALRECEADVPRRARDEGTKEYSERMEERR